MSKFVRPQYLEIPISDGGEVHVYEKAILDLLHRVEIQDCDPSLAGHIKSVYRLLHHIQSAMRENGYSGTQGMSKSNHSTANKLSK